MVQISQDHFPGEALHRVHVAENWSAQGIPVPEDLVEENVDVLIGRILHHVDLLDDVRNINPLL